jgi:hypothetical protein
MAQLALFGRGEAPSFDPAISGMARVVLADGAWIPKVSQALPRISIMMRPNW